MHMARRKVGLSRAQINQSRAVFQSLSQKQFVSQVKEERKKREVLHNCSISFLSCSKQELCVQRQGAEQGGAVRLCVAGSSCSLTSLLASLFVPLCFCSLNCMRCFAVSARLRVKPPKLGWDKAGWWWQLAGVCGKEGCWLCLGWLLLRCAAEQCAQCK